MAEDIQLLEQRVGKQQAKVKQTAAVVTMTHDRHAAASSSHQGIQAGAANPRLGSGQGREEGQAAQEAGEEGTSAGVGRSRVIVATPKLS